MKFITRSTIALVLTVGVLAPSSSAQLRTPSVSCAAANGLEGGMPELAFATCQKTGAAVTELGGLPSAEARATIVYTSPMASCQESFRFHELFSSVFAQNLICN